MTYSLKSTDVHSSTYAQAHLQSVQIHSGKSKTGMKIQSEVCPPTEVSIHITVACSRRNVESIWTLVAYVLVLALASDAQLLLMILRQPLPILLFPSEEAHFLLALEGWGSLFASHLRHRRRVRNERTACWYRHTYLLIKPGT